MLTVNERGPSCPPAPLIISLICSSPVKSQRGVSAPSNEKLTGPDGTCAAQNRTDKAKMAMNKKRLLIAILISVSCLHRQRRVCPIERISSRSTVQQQCLF